MWNDILRDWRLGTEFDRCRYSYALIMLGFTGLAIGFTTTILAGENPITPDVHDVGTQRRTPPGAIHNHFQHGRLSMKLSDKGLAAIVLHEGIVPGPYRDSVGVWTYGIGHTAGAGKPYPANMPRGMPADLDAELAKVVDLFRKDLAKFEARVNEAIKVPVSQHEYDAAVSFDFNTGGIHRAEWVRTLNAGDRAKAAQQIMNWQKPSEIIPRRKAEQRLFRDGVYPTGKATVWQVTESGSVIWRAVKQVDPMDLIGTAPGESGGGFINGLIAALVALVKGLFQRKEA